MTSEPNAKGQVLFLIVPSLRLRGGVCRGDVMRSLYFLVREIFEAGLNSVG